MCTAVGYESGARFAAVVHVEAGTALGRQFLQVGISVEWIVRRRCGLSVREERTRVL